MGEVRHLGGRFLAEQMLRLASIDLSLLGRYAKDLSEELLHDVSSRKDSLSEFSPLLGEREKTVVAAESRKGFAQVQKYFKVLATQLRTADKELGGWRKTNQRAGA